MTYAAAGQHLGAGLVVAAACLLAAATLWSLLQALRGGERRWIHAAAVATAAICFAAMKLMWPLGMTGAGLALAVAGAGLALAESGARKLPGVVQLLGGLAFGLLPLAA